MKVISIFLVAAMILFSSCSSSKTAQSSDDPYYSPSSRAYSSSNQGQYYDANPNDQYLMMKVQDPDRWSSFDDYGYDSYYPYSTGFYPYASFGLGFGYGFYNPFSPWGTYGFWDPYYGYIGSYYAWNSFYNPYYYYTSVAYVGGKTSSYNAYTSFRPFAPSPTSNKFASNSNAFRTRTGMNANFRPVYASQRTNSFSSSNYNRSYSQPARSSFSTGTSSFGNGGGGARFGGGGGGGFGRH